MTHAEYNKRVQEAQEFCLQTGLKYKVDAEHDASLTNPLVARFRVYYDKWVTIGTEVYPFSDRRVCTFFDEEWIMLKSRVVRDLF